MQEKNEVPQSHPHPIQADADNKHDPQPPKNKKRGNVITNNLSTLAILILAPLLAITMATFVFQTYEVDGPSMESTLQNKDRLIVLKTDRTKARITRKHYIPDRYDIIVFNERADFGFDGQVAEKQLIKRVIGVPGDRVVVKDGIVTVYNKANPEGFLVDREGPEKLAIGVTSGNIDQTIRDGEVFVMGDNRENSLDSRAFGTVNADDIVGKLAVRIYPFDKVQRFHP